MPIRLLHRHKANKEGEHDDKALEHAVTGETIETEMKYGDQRKQIEEEKRRRKREKKKALKEEKGAKKKKKKGKKSTEEGSVVLETFCAADRPARSLSCHATLMLPFICCTVTHDHPLGTQTIARALLRGLSTST